MGNRWSNQFQATLAKGIITLYGKTSFGAAGAPTIIRGTNFESQGIATFVRNSTGDFTITLQDNWVAYVGATFTWDESSNSGTAPLAPIVFVKARTVTTVGGGTIEIVTGAYTAGAATDPANGEILVYSITLKNCTAP